MTAMQDVTALAEISGYDPDAEGKQTVTAYYSENGVRKGATIVVNNRRSKILQNQRIRIRMTRMKGRSRLGLMMRIPLQLIRPQAMR